jgi:hypothetical protein
MQRRNLIVLLGACAIGLMLAAFPGPAVNANQPPRPGVVAVVKQEYDSAKRQNLLQNRFSCATTGQLGRHGYWYCRSGAINLQCEGQAMKDVTLDQDEETILITKSAMRRWRPQRALNERWIPSPSPRAQRCISVRALKDPSGH